MKCFLQRATQPDSILSVDIVDARRAEAPLPKRKPESAFLRIALLDEAGAEDPRFILPLKPLDSLTLNFVRCLPLKGAPSAAYDRLSAKDALDLIIAGSELS